MSRFPTYYHNQQIGKWYDWTDPNNPYTARQEALLNERYGINLSSSHRRKNGKFVDGGGWWMRKEESIIQPSNPVTVVRANRRYYSGSFITGDASWDPAPRWWNSDNHKNNILNHSRKLGAQAYNSMRPAQPNFSGLNALYELRDVPKMLQQATKVIRDRIWKVRDRSGRSSMSRAGEWYLAIEFGWLPLLNDIQDFSRTQAREQDIIKQLIKDEGKPIRRSRNLPNYWGDQGDGKTVTNSWQYAGGHPWNTHMSPTLVTQAYGKAPERTNYESWHIARTWAEGQFRYLLPPGPRTVDWTKKIRSRIYGFRPTPSVVYNAMPWTWLADYFTGLGDFIDSTSGGVEDQLITDYFFVMSHMEWGMSTEASQSVMVGEDAEQTVTSTKTHKWVIKSRVPASPFGFGVKDSDLSPKQVAILGALGLSKLP